MPDVQVKVSEWLGQRDPWGAYGVDLLDELEGLGIEVVVDKDEPLAVIRGPENTGYIRGMTGKAFWKEANQKVRTPKGPAVADDEIRYEHMVYGGWQLANALCFALTGYHPDMFGRGSSFRASVKHLSDSGF